jgi:hypothetical protein
MRPWASLDWVNFRKTRRVLTLPGEGAFPLRT